jgi:Spy/CpxP family protein refolding chaperone
MTIRPLNVAAMILMALAGSMVMAQGVHAPDLGQHAEQIQAKLNLRDEQVEALLPILENSMLQQQRILSSYGIDLNVDGEPGDKPGLRAAWAMKLELEAVRADTLASVGDILSDKQLDAFKHLQNQRRAEMRERIRSRRE